MTQTISIDTSTVQEIIVSLRKLSQDVKDIKENMFSKNFPMVDEETNRQIGESLKAYKEGRYIEVDPSNEEQMNELVGLK